MLAADKRIIEFSTILLDKLDPNNGGSCMGFGKEGIHGDQENTDLPCNNGLESELDRLWLNPRNCVEINANREGLVRARKSRRNSTCPASMIDTNSERSPWHFFLV